MVTFTLRRIGKPIAMAAREDCTAVKDRNPPTAPTGRAEEPMSLTAHVTGRGIEIDRIFFSLPFAAMIPLAIVKDHSTRFRPDID